MGRTSNPELQEKLANIKRNAILDAARGVFAEKDFHRATIKDVAARAGVADGTVYNYFENKDALLLGIFDQMAALAQQDIDPEALLELDLHDFLRTFFTHPLRDFEANNFELFRVVLSKVMTSPEMGQRFSTQVLGPLLGAEGFLELWGQRHGVEFEGLELKIRALSGMILGLIVQRLLGDETLASRWDELPNVLTDLLLEGLAPQGS